MQKKLTTKLVWVSALLYKNEVRIFGVYDKKRHAKECCEYYYEKFCEENRINCFNSLLVNPLLYRTRLNKLVDGKEGWGITWENHKYGRKKANS